MKLIVLGTRGSARVMAMVARACGHTIRGYVGDGEPGTVIGNATLLGPDEWLLLQPSCDLLIGVGHPSIRHLLSQRFSRFSFPNLVHPSSSWDKRERNVLGKGNVLSIGTLFTCDITVGNYCQFNMGSQVGHDVRIGDCCVINPGSSISGYVRLGNRVLVGTGARILEGLTVGDDAKIGAGAVVTKDVPARTTVVGVPATILACEVPS